MESSAGARNPRRSPGARAPIVDRRLGDGRRGVGDGGDRHIHRYPWYREAAATSARSQLLANPDTAAWHTFGMEWKEHVAWIAPMLATAVAFMVTYYGRRLVLEDRMRRLAMALFTSAFLAAAVAGVFGAFINKAAPIR